MLVKDYMTRHPIMIEETRRAVDAQRMMVENKIRHLPVVNDGKRLVGLVTRDRLSITPDRLGSLDVWEITRLLSDLTVEKVMLKGDDLRTIDPDATLERAARLMIQHKIGSLPVLENDIVVGIITKTDLLIELQNLLGATEKGWRVTMRVPNRDGEFSRLTNPLTEHGWSIMALGSVRSPKDDNFWDIVLKVSGGKQAELQSILESISDQELLDIRATQDFSANSA